MSYIKNIGISFGFILGSMLGLTLIVTLFHYLSWINSKTLSILEIMIPLIAMILGGFTIGKRSQQKGWLEGLKLALIFLIVLVLFQYLGLKVTFSFKMILFYLMLIVSCMLGSMIGINRRKLDSNR